MSIDNEKFGAHGGDRLEHCGDGGGLRAAIARR